MHDFWWNDDGWARCVCGEYLCVVGRQFDPVAAGVADWARDTHRTTLALRAMYAEEISAAVERTLLKFEELRDAALALGEGEHGRSRF
ncbi:MAG: hypothetical protein IE935_09980 [Micrococcales bacterium]|nr:hypothetical protein [Micrococcales bacterium]